MTIFGIFGCRSNNIKGVFTMNHTRDELKREAERLGHTNLTDQQLTQFAKAKAAAELLSSFFQKLREGKNLSQS